MEAVARQILSLPEQEDTFMEVNLDEPFIAHVYV